MEKATDMTQRFQARHGLGRLLELTLTELSEAERERAQQTPDPLRYRGRRMAIVHWGGNGSHAGREVYDSESLATLTGKPVYDLKPDENGELVDPVRVFQPERGKVLELRPW